MLPLYHHHHLRTFSTNQHSLKRLLLQSNSYTFISSSRTRSIHRSSILQRHEILTLDVPTFDGKWILPSHVHYHIQPSSESSSSKDNRISNHHEAILGSSSLLKTSASLTPPILLICGWAGAGTCDWGALPKLISHQTKRHVITFDPRGIGNAMIQKTSQNDEEGLVPKESISFHSMALDALAVIQTYYQTMQKINAKNQNITSNNISSSSDSKMTFCVGGVSMGGIIAQHIASMTSTTSSCDDENPIVPLHDQFEVSSLGLICTSLAKHITPSKQQQQQQHQEYYTKILQNDNHFLNSFDQWPSSSSSSTSSTTKRNMNDLDDQLKLKCIQNFFNAMGDSFLAKPGRKALQTKLMKGFIQTRKGFFNGDNQGILQQKNLLMKYHAHIFHNDNDYHKFAQHDDALDTDMIVLDAMKRKQGTNAPFLIIHGDEDRVIPVSHAKVMHIYLQSDSQNSDATISLVLLVEALMIRRKILSY